MSVNVTKCHMGLVILLWCERLKILVPTSFMLDLFKNNTHVTGAADRGAFCVPEKEKLMLYIIMCGGDYPTWDTPRQLLKVGSETILERTMRLLRECGVDNIAISSNDDRFEAFGVPVLRHVNDYTSVAYNQDLGYWCNAFYPTDEPTCYLMGDVFFSPEAIRTIVDTETDDIAFFGSAFPFAPEYPKPYIEPFAFKVVDTDHLKAAVEEVKRLDAEGKFNRQPIAWEVWNVINGNADPNYIDPNSYVHINDYTCDIDWPSETSLVERFAHHG